ncbi:unnamed protein product [Arctia plantaginis]|uniref:Phosphatidate cytidylyltransferase, mitochondrial n=1 Tax=Arctia plantaginis TaxID=874455 RepID=A0A8S0ZF95_ARCPL|nr:unnamed protein product [Arctia plantaginis]CAB3237459.1 unnamed protein product [Arctia plantaginis]
MASAAVKVMAGVTKDFSPLYYRILSKFPQNFTFCFAYGSAVKPQTGNQNKQNMIDLIYCVDNSHRWHGANIELNKSHYSALRYLGKGFIARFQENWGAKVYFNTLVEIKEENVVIKYGVVSQKDLIGDLLDWNDLYLAGRLHKPVTIIKQINSTQLQSALQSNLRSAVHTALLTLPETFTEYDFYYAISNLSYAGDFRMTFGENKNKVRNIVQPQLLSFRELYRPILQQFHAYVDISTGDAQCHQDIHPETKLHHLMQLPMVPQQRIVKFWNHGGPQQDMEDVLRAVAYDIDCAIVLRQILKDIVWQSSVRQSLKGILTAGIKMLSDESSSDSETGRFKGRTKKEEQTSKQKSDNSRETGRSRHSGNDRFQRYSDRRRDDRDNFDKHSRDRDRHRFSRNSPIRRRHSRDRSQNRRSHEKNKHRESTEKTKYREYRSNSRDRHKNSGFRSYALHDNSKDQQEGTRRSTVRDKSPEKQAKKARDKSLSPRRGKRSEIYVPPPLLAIEKRAPERKKSESPIMIDENDHSDHEEVLLGSYYKMIPAVIKDKSEESSEIDSSDDERLRAKLLNLEKELHKTKKQKKHKKKHKRKSLKSSKERELRDTSVSVEVSSTTDIAIKPDVALEVQLEVMEEVSSTQKHAQKESCEEGEISSDDSQGQIDIDPTDLRHKLRRGKPKSNVCGPALPPHLEKQYKRSASPEIEGPALPPHLKRSCKIGPSIPDNMRKVLSEREQEVVKYESSDDDGGIGPLPVGSEEKWSDAHRRLEERALDIKIKNLDGSTDPKVKSREKWMLELPEGKAKYIGLEARSFRAKEGPDMSDRSTWTDTPKEKARKAAGLTKEEDLDTQLKEEARMRHIINRDEEQESAIKKHKKKHKREESLLEMHQKKLKKKKKKEEKDDGKKERRPFSRDVDLQVNRFDEAQKKSIIKKAQDLNTRFGKGEAKYL